MDKVVQLVGGGLLSTGPTIKNGASSDKLDGVIPRLVYDWMHHF